MPRGAPRRQTKQPAVPITYEVSEIVGEVAHRLIRLYPAAFGWTANFKIGFLMIHGSRPKPDPTFDFMAKFRKVPPLYHGLTGYDAVIEVQEWAWRGLNANQQEALTAHELSHGEMTEKGTLRVVRHDLEEFRFVVRNWGAWQPTIRAFDEQLSLFDDAGAPTRATEGAQEPLSNFRTPEAIAADVAKMPAADQAVVQAALDFKRAVEAGTTDVTITAGGKSATIKGKGKANGSSTAAPLS